MEQLPKSPKEFSTMLRNSLQRCLHQRHSRILVDVEDSISLEVENSSAKDKTKRELARLIVEMFYGTGIPVTVAFCNGKELQVAQTTWGASTQQWVGYFSLDKVGKRGFQDIGVQIADEQVWICVDPKAQQLDSLLGLVDRPGQVVVLINPRRIQQNTNLLSSLHQMLKQFTPVLVLRRYMVQGKRCLLYNRFPSNWYLFTFQNRQKKLVFEAKDLPRNEQTLCANLHHAASAASQVGSLPSFWNHWPLATWWKNFSPKKEKEEEDWMQDL
ncbi:hypothetical protein GAYE_SCF64G6712 [Galdieria yellowstonensis]|uniref:DUF1995 domain-containing protein n=1 Tax=Galdieria yellowstonensis TaxID=3028027 RepID=A0AAV9INN0_9RHOD|nr:hypothetical protein GAYE_SCF64G6712 [Galdieria yellowstonensis]